MAKRLFVGNLPFTTKDDQRFRQMFVAMKLRLQDRNRRFWRARSYSPNLYRGAHDAWHV